MAGQKRNHLMPPQELLDDLCSRFLLNVPEEDLESFERICFLLEEAHWFYEDNSVEQNPSLKSLSFKEFIALMFKSCAVLRPYTAHLDEIYKNFISYKLIVPVSGVIMLDESYERCLLVKGWKAGSSWSFPRGKKSKDEEDHTCAVREALEETGFDVSEFLRMDDYIEVVLGQQRVRLYIITGVKVDDAIFAPRTKKEISEISWHRIDDLHPAGDYVISRGVNGLKLYMVAPFLANLKEWISVHPSPASQSDTYPRETCVWKAKCCSGGAATSESTLLRSSSESPNVVDMAPGRSFRTFGFNTGSILQAVEDAFAVC